MLNFNFGAKNNLKTKEFYNEINNHSYRRWRI